MFVCRVQLLLFFRFWFLFVSIFSAFFSIGQTIHIGRNERANGVIRDVRFLQSHEKLWKISEYLHIWIIQMRRMVKQNRMKGNLFTAWTDSSSELPARTDLPHFNKSFDKWSQINSQTLQEYSWVQSNQWHIICGHIILHLIGLAVWIVVVWFISCGHRNGLLSVVYTAASWSGTKSTINNVHWFELVDFAIVE